MNRVILVAHFLLLIMFLIIPFGFCYTLPQIERRGIYYETEYRVSPNSTVGNNTLWNDFSFFAEYNITNIYFLVKEDYVFYNSSIVPMNTKYDWDVLKEACKIADHFNLSIYSWMVVFRDRHLFNQNSTVRMVDINGNPLDGWVNPAIPEVRKYILDTIQEIIRNYNVKGIHLDYIRYPGNGYGYDNYSRTVFMNKYGFDPKVNPNAPEWLEWRCEQITSFVNETKILVKSFNPQLEVSCAVIPTAAESRISYLQNWEEWSDKRLVDYLMPMCYTDDNAKFENLVKNSTVSVGKKVGLMVGIGIYVYANYSNGNETLLQQWDIARKHNCEGWILFRDEFIYNFTGALRHINDIPPPWYQNPYVFGIILGIVILAIIVAVYMFKKFHEASKHVETD